ncbi:MAG: hypothetical protein ACMUHY_08285, partial [Thermoplasmatota archaeon]
MKVTYDKEPRCYICGRNEEELNFFLLEDRKELGKALKKAKGSRKRHMEKIVKTNREVHLKHMKHVEKTPINYEFTMEVIQKDFDAFSKIIPDLRELVDLYLICDKVHQESKLVELVKVLGDYHNEDQLAEDGLRVKYFEFRAQRRRALAQQV